MVSLHAAIRTFAVLALMLPATDPAKAQVRPSPADPFEAAASGSARPPSRSLAPTAFGAPVLQRVEDCASAARQHQTLAWSVISARCNVPREILPRGCARALGAGGLVASNMRLGTRGGGLEATATALQRMEESIVICRGSALGPASGRP